MIKERVIKLGTDGKSLMKMRVYRAKTGKWEELSFLWYLKNFLRELGVQFSNLFRKERQYATVLTQVGEEWIVDKLDEVVQTTGDFIGWGTGAGTATKASTALFTEAIPAAWTASTAYALNALVRPTTQTRYGYRCITAGTSGTIEPTWPTVVGETVTDGTVVWICYALRVIATRSQPVADKIRWVGTLTSAAAQTITNAGNFTAAVAGVLIVHGDFTGISLGIGDKIEFTIEIEVT